MLSKLNADGTWSPITGSRYPDGMPLFTHHDTSEPSTYLLRTTSLEDFTAALFYLDAVLYRGGYIEHLILPWIPGARQDRINPNGDVLFTLKSIATMLNERNINHVWVLDPHSDVAPALIQRCHVWHSDVLAHHPLIADVSYNGVIAPDSGAEKRARRWANRLAVPLYHAGKRRDVTTGKLTGFWCEPLMAGHYLVVDDICDGGGTFIGLADAICVQEPLVRLSLFVSHGLFTNGAIHYLRQRYERLITTDSLVDSRDGVTIVPTVHNLTGSPGSLSWSA
jgi:ribose-phosphate pyrophosphokinase